MFEKIELVGFRGFASSQTLKIAQPNNKYGSGLTILVGENNAGKSTIVEAFRALSQRNPPSFTQGRRNIRAGDQIIIRMLID